MGQSFSVALKSIRMEFKRFKRRQHSETNIEEHQSILAASKSCAVAFEDPDAPIVDPPFL